MTVVDLGGYSYPDTQLSMTDANYWRASGVTNVSNNFLVKVSTNKFAVVYNDSGVKITVFTVDFNGKIDSISREQSLSGLTAGDIKHACYLEDDKIFIVHGSRCAIVTVSTLTATDGTEQSQGTDALCVALSSTQVILIQDDGNFRLATVSGTSISLSSTFTVTSYVTDGDIERSRAIAYDSSSVVLVGGSDGTATTGFAIHFTFDTGTPSGTQDSKITLGSTAAVWADLVMLDSTNFVGVDKNMARAFSRSGTTLTALDSEYTDVACAEFPAATKISNTRIVCFDSLGTISNASLSTLKALDVNTGVLSSFDELNCELYGNVSENRMITADNGFFILTGRRGNTTNAFLHTIQVFRP